jgi:antitoxin (DNA-binding transcriptional repressor) of toxin-antitoxin stability system
MAESISKSKLKAKMLAIFRELESSGSELIVTDHGKPVLKIVPLKQENTVAELFASLQGRVAYAEDINHPTQAEWMTGK